MIKSILKKHQKQAVEKLSKIKVGGLFMDMGAGKTLAVLALFNLKYNVGKCSKCLFFTPFSNVGNIKNEIAKHTNLVIDKDIFVIGIESVQLSDRLYLELLNICDNAFLIVDESILIKNHIAKRTNRLTQIAENCAYKFILTGRPIGKFVQDLYSQFALLDKRILGYNSFYSFAHNHLEYDVHTIKSDRPKVYRSHNIEYLTKKIEPYIYQCKITDIIDMPERIYKFREFEITEEQYEIYQQSKNEILNGKLMQEANDKAIFNLFTALQTIVSGFKYKIKEPIFDNPLLNPRIIVLKEIIQEINPEYNVIIYTKFKSEISDISTLLNELGETYAIIDGEHKEFDKFDSSRFIIINIQSGSRGLNLQFANYVIFYSSSFDREKREQAEARIWRQGQDRACVFITIQSNTGIDKFIDANLTKKKELILEFDSELMKWQKSIKI